MAQKPLVAIKAGIAELLTGDWIEQTDANPGAVRLRDGTLLSRANVMGIIVEVGDAQPPGLVLDDGSERMVVRAFENVPGLAQVTLGSPVMVIARPRRFGDQRFLVPECVRSIDPMWIQVRKRELAGRTLLPAMPVRPSGIVEEDVVRSHGTSILDSIRSLDKGTGADTEELLTKAKCTQDDLERLLVRGEIFEISPGKLKVLE
jgi:hypothetical protein